MLDKLTFKKALIGTAFGGVGIAGICLMSIGKSVESLSGNLNPNDIKDPEIPVALDEFKNEVEESIPSIPSIPEDVPTKPRLPEGHSIIESIKTQDECKKTTHYVQYWIENNCVSKPAPVARYGVHKFSRNQYSSFKKKNFKDFFAQPKSDSPSKSKIYELDLLEAAQVDGSGIIIFIKKDKQFNDYRLPHHVSITHSGQRYSVRVDDLCSWERKRGVGGSTDLLQIFNENEADDNKKVWSCVYNWDGFVEYS